MSDKAIKAVDVRAKTDDELETLITDLKKEQFNLRFQQATGQLENTAEFRRVRKDIARVRTVQIQRKTQQEQGS